MDKQTRKDALATAAGALTGSTLGIVAGYAATNASDEHHTHVETQEEMLQPQEEVSVISPDDITTDDILIESEVEPIAPIYGGSPMIEPEGPMPIDIGPDMYDPDPLSDEGYILPDDLDTGNFDAPNHDVFDDTYMA